VSPLTLELSGKERRHQYAGPPGPAYAFLIRVMTLHQEQQATALIVRAQQGDAAAYAELLTMLAANKTPVMSYHFAWPGYGHVAKAGDGFHYYPEPMQMTL